MAYILSPAQNVSGLGNPSYALGLSGIADWEVVRFIDRAKQARGWGNRAKADENRDITGLILDNGESTRIFNISFRGYDPVDAESTFRITWDGSGTITAGNNVFNLSGSTSGATFTSRVVGGTWLNFNSIDYANPPRNVSIIRADQIALHEAGEIFDPGMVSEITGFSCLRFMDWGRTNNAIECHWADRPSLSWQEWARVPIEVMVALCNKTNSDGWFCISHMATDDYITQYATYIKNNLKPELRAYFEYSNETWNTASGFFQSAWLRRKAWEEWGPAGWSWNPQLAGTFYSQNWATGPWYEQPLMAFDGATYFDNNYESTLNGGYEFDWFANIQYGAKRSVEVAQIIRTVFGTLRRAKCVLGFWTAQNSRNVERLACSYWQSADPDNFVLPASVHDAACCAGYFYAKPGDTNDGQDFLDAFALGGQDEVVTTLLARNQDSITNDVSAYFSQCAALARDNNLQLIMYEGNQHNDIASSGSLIQDNADILAAFETANYSQAMAALQDQVRDAFKAAGGTLPCAFTDISESSKFGSWGHRRWIGDENSIWTGLKAWQTANPRWWIR